MAQSLVQIYLHLVFSTKDRIPHLKDNTLRDRLHAYMAGTCQKQESPAIQIGGTEDHVHLFLRMGKSLDASTLVRELKRDSTKWLKKESPTMDDFQWQRGYGAFSVSPSHVGAVTDYIKNQEEHHRQESFQDEFRRLCSKYMVELDERYVWG